MSPLIDVIRVPLGSRAGRVICQASPPGTTVAPRGVAAPGIGEVMIKPVGASARMIYVPGATLTKEYCPASLIVVVEAMCLGKPVIATKPGGPEEIVRDGRDGLLVPPNAPAPMAEAIRRLLEDPAARASFVGLLRAATSEPEASEVVRDLLATRLLVPIAERVGGDAPELRAALMASQIVGLLMARYVVVSLRRGEVKFFGSRPKRQEQPGLYWSAIGLYSASATCIALVTLLLATMYATRGFGPVP